MYLLPTRVHSCLSASCAQNSITLTALTQLFALLTPLALQIFSLSKVSSSGLYDTPECWNRLCIASTISFAASSDAELE